MTYYGSQPAPDALPTTYGQPMQAAAAIAHPQQYQPQQYQPQQYQPQQYQPQQYQPQQYQPQQYAAAAQPGPAFDPSSANELEANFGDGAAHLDAGDEKMLGGDIPVSIRHGFIRKVYCILFVQLAITFGLALMFGFWKAAGEWIEENSWLWIVSTVFMFIVLLALVCIPGVARRSPINLVLLFFFSALFGILMGYLAVSVSMESFLSALGITLAVVVAITIFACQVKVDFTGFAPYALVLLIVLMVFGIIAAIVQDRIVNLVYGALGALLFSFYLVFDTQMVIGGKHKKYQFSIDDYVLGALTLYLDIINIFTYILMIMENA